jgi:hypothetical protein
VKRPRGGSSVEVGERVTRLPYARSLARRGIPPVFIRYEDQRQRDKYSRSDSLTARCPNSVPSRTMRLVLDGQILNDRINAGKLQSLTMG